MASSRFELDIAQRSLLEEGFFDFDDSLVGERVLDMENRGFPYFTEYGLEFCKQFALDAVRGDEASLGNDLIISSASDLSSKPPSKGAALGTGLDTKNSQAMSNAFAGVVQKLAGGC